MFQFGFRSALLLIRLDSLEEVGRGDRQFERGKELCLERRSRLELFLIMRLALLVAG